MDFYSLPKDIQDDIKKLASQHTVNIETAQEYYMMGGYEHADHLCILRDKGIPDWIVKLENDTTWKEKNKILFEELKRLSQ